MFVYNTEEVLLDMVGPLDIYSAEIVLKQVRIIEGGALLVIHGVIAPMLGNWCYFTLLLGILTPFSTLDPGPSDRNDYWQLTAPPPFFTPAKSVRQFEGTKQKRVVTVDGSEILFTTTFWMYKTL